MPSTKRNRSARKNEPILPAEAQPAPAELVITVEQKPPAPIVSIERESAPGTERIGDILRHRRQQRGDDLQQIADYLCIRKGFLAALENCDYDELPADAYAVGFLRSYAAYLGFDGADAINRYRNEMAGRRRKPSLAMPTPIAEGRTPSTFIMIGAAVTAILIYATWYGFSAATRSSMNVSPALPQPAVTENAPVASPSLPTPPATVQAPPSISATTSVGAPTATAPVGIALAGPAEPIAAAPPSVLKPVIPEAEAPKPAKAAPKTADEKPDNAIDNSEEPVADAKPHLVLRAEKETWVHIADSKDETVFDRVMKPGDTFPVPPNMPGLKLTTGNSGGIVLVLDGKDLPKLAHDSSILHDIPLDVDKLKTTKAKAPKPAPPADE